ncbi:TIGR02186 family protein [Thermodesulfovibrio sp. 3907-1M]|uniref:TIGR02186 family protein n=1 Tax=Thermodesulfovibrio autotrophicus TaxID=3118333 RepID=A0AAU8H0W5_9BACT
MKKLMIFFALIFLIVISNNAWAKISVIANHDHITIDLFYHGSTVSVKGQAQPGSDIVVKITSPDGSQVLRKKGKVLDLVWMSVENLQFDNVPNLYILRSTKELKDILKEQEAVKNKIGYSALKNFAQITPVSNENEKEELWNEFIKFKEKSKLYNVKADIAKSEENGQTHYYTLIQWPYQAPPGIYNVTAYEIKDGKVIDTAQTQINVEKVGILKMLSNMAKNNSLFYGIVCILIAILAGFSVGVLFKKAGKAH